MRSDSPVSGTWTTRKLADFVLSTPYERISESARRAAVVSLMDLVAAAAGGRNAASAASVGRVARRLFTPGSAGIWFSKDALRAPGAALVNSAMASALDIDDGHRLAGGHPGASIIPAAMAVAQETDASGPELIAAVAMGYEVGVRVAAARDFSKQITLSTGRWCAYGAAAAAGRLRNVAPETLAQALAIAGIESPDQAAAAYSNLEGNSVKEGIPWATLTGLTALELAVEGFTGPLDILDHPDYYDAARILPEPGNSWAIEGAYLKPYACCRWIHGAIDALLSIMADHDIRPEAIQAATVHTFSRAAGLTNYPAPDSLESAQYSIPFCLAAAAVEGPESLLPLSEDRLGSEPILAFAARIGIQEDPALNPLFPRQAPARVHVTCADAQFETTVYHALGDPDNPMDMAGISRKFDRLGKGLPDDRRNAIRASVQDVEAAGPSPLWRALRM